MLNEKILYSGGFEICVWKDIFEIYVPLVYSKDIANTLKLNNRTTFFETIRFTFNLNKISPRDLIEKSIF
jgi:hypothetical protein